MKATIEYTRKDLEALLIADARGAIQDGANFRATWSYLSESFTVTADLGSPATGETAAIEDQAPAPCEPFVITDGNFDA